ncbi:hypothetical protein E2C01_050119 [Portunus trituberculatus]|uniref:Uncharacterized protein n=1 Tax=Portunus trituberculatus TaxID=210409 RepID=A0A5B7GF14_PORTR|nr:hypothetical protein [Portunus trituberculatus]
MHHQARTKSHQEMLRVLNSCFVVLWSSESSVKEVQVLKTSPKFHNGNDSKFSNEAFRVPTNTTRDNQHPRKDRKKKEEGNFCNHLILIMIYLILMYRPPLTHYRDL